MKSPLLLLIFLAISYQIVAHPNEDSPSDCRVLIIDFGATNTRAGLQFDGQYKILLDGSEHYSIPSVVAFTDDGILVGQAAMDQALTNPSRTIIGISHLVGRKYSDPFVQQLIGRIAYKIIDQDGRPAIQVEIQGEKKVFTPEEISALIFTEVRKYAERYLGMEIKDTLIAVPASFNELQRQAVKEAGENAGLKVQRIVSDPISASWAYGFDKLSDKNILFLHLGGETSEATILAANDGVFEVLSNVYDPSFGGKDFTQKLMNYYVSFIYGKYDIDISNDKQILSRLRGELEKAKRAVSVRAEHLLEIKNIFDGEDFFMVFARDDFEHLTSDLYVKVLQQITQALKEAHLTKDQIHEVVLLGGSTKIPKLQQLVKDYFNGKEISKSINSDEAVIHGAAIQARCLCNPDKGRTKCFDMTPMTMGIEGADGTLLEIIPRHSYIPVKKSKTISIELDGQTPFSLKVFEGERPLANDNVLLADLVSNKISPSPARAAEIEVTFDIGADSILRVTAEEKGTGVSEIFIVSQEKAKLSQEEIERMIREAEIIPEVDPEAKRMIDARNSLDEYLFTVKQIVEDHHRLGNKINEADKEKIIRTIMEAQGWLDNNQKSTEKEFIQKRKETECILNPILNQADPSFIIKGDACLRPDYVDL